MRGETVDHLNLDANALAAELPQLTVEHYLLLPSTQDRAREAASHPLTSTPLLIVAEQQTAGRGRENNTWWTGPGSLAFSLLIEPSSLGLPAAPVPCLSLAVSVGIIDAVAPRLAPESRGGQDREHPIAIGLHWPNDVFVGDRKLAGVLVEALSDGRLIIGVGVNVNNSSVDAPPQLRARVGTLRDCTGQVHELTPLLTEIVRQILGRLQELAADADSVGRRFNELCLQRGRRLELYLGDQTIVGQCLGIAPDGGLLLDTGSGPAAFHCGTLHRSHKN